MEPTGRLRRPLRSAREVPPPDPSTMDQRLELLLGLRILEDGGLLFEKALGLVCLLAECHFGVGFDPLRILCHGSVTHQRRPLLQSSLLLLGEAVKVRPVAKGLL